MVIQECVWIGFQNGHKIEKKVIVQYSGVSLVLYSLLLPHNPTEWW